jgi:membrane protein required for colicin V production
MVNAELNFNLFDGIVFTILGVSALISLYRGFIREFLSLATWFGAGIVTLAFADNIIAFLENHLSSATAAAIIGTMGTYFTVLIIFGMLSRTFVRYVRDGTEVGWVDNVMGLVFGFIKGGLIIVLMFIMGSFIFKADGYPSWVQNAYTLPVVRDVSASVAKMLPDYLGNAIPSDTQTDPMLTDPDMVNGDIPIETQQQNMELQSTEPMDLEQRLLNEMRRAKEQKATIPQDDSSKLEQLINDVTKPREQDAY